MPPVITSSPSAAPTPAADQQDEVLDVVDETNTPISTAPRKQCHEEGLLHRSTHIFLFRSHLVIGRSSPQIQVLLQQRSEQKKLGPGLWDVTVAEHVSAGESYREASVRGMREEIGLSVGEGMLVEVRKPYLSKQFYEEVGVLDHMFTSTFAVLYEQREMGTMAVDEVEVERVEWWDVRRVVRDARERPEKFTRWLSIELQSFDLEELGRRMAGEM